MYVPLYMRTMIRVGKPNHFNCSATINLYESIYGVYIKLVPMENPKLDQFFYLFIFTIFGPIIFHWSPCFNSPTEDRGEARGGGRVPLQHE